LQKLNEEREAEIEKASRIYYVYRNPDYSSESYRVFIADYFDNLSQFIAEREKSEGGLSSELEIVFVGNKQACDALIRQLEAVDQQAINDLKEKLNSKIAEFAGQSQNFDPEVGSPPTQTGSGRRDWTIFGCPLSQLPPRKRKTAEKFA
ncbi:hypothetical protein, partial [Lacticaseibacillus paracasei]